LGTLTFTTPPVWVKRASALLSPKVKNCEGLMLKVPAVTVTGPPESEPTLKRLVAPA